MFQRKRKRDPAGLPLQRGTFSSGQQQGVLWGRNGQGGESRLGAVPWGRYGGLGVCMWVSRHLNLTGWGTGENASTGEAG